MSDLTPTILAALAALTVSYLLGSLPSAQLFARLGGKDIFETGSGNMGTMNALRNLGPVYGVLTFLLDVLKGVAAVMLAPLLAGMIAPDSAVAADWAIAAALVGAALGHIYPVFTGFRGGKALAVAFGAILPLSWQVAVAALVLIALLVVLLRNVNLASIISISAAALAIIIPELTVSVDAGSIGLTIGILLLVALIVHKHLPVTASGSKPPQTRP